MAETSVALVVVDVQCDFCPRGALAVTNGDKVIAPINELLSVASRYQRPVVATRDWHPRDSTHFTTGGGNWPPHCVIDSAGARFHPDLHLPTDVIVVSKGISVDADGYSGFEGVDAGGASLLSILRPRKIDAIVVCGLATDYCVRATALDGIQFDLTVVVVSDAIAPVNLTPQAGEQAVQEMRDAGVRLADTESAKRFLINKSVSGLRSSG